MQKIRIDFDNPGLPQHISAVENDSQSRFFQATLYENGKAYTAPEGATYSIMYRGFGPQNQGWYDTINDGAGKRAACAVSGNVVTCEIARQALQVPGHVSILLCVTTGKGYMLKSWPIECDCKNDRYDSTAEIQSFFYITQVSNESWTQAFQVVEELKNTIDPTLSLSGKAADAAKVGEAVGELKEDVVNKSEGQIRGLLVKDSYVKQDGTIADYAGWSRTNYIDVSQYSVLSLYISKIIRFGVWLKEDKKTVVFPIATTTIGNITLFVPLDAKYLIISELTEEMEKAKISVKRRKPDNLDVNGKRVNINYIANGYIEHGNLQSAGRWAATDYIEIPKNLYIESDGTEEDNAYNAFYDENKVYISSFNTKGKYIKVPDNAKYIRLSTLNSNEQRVYTRNPLLLKVGSFNVGIWTDGKSSNARVDPANVKTEGIKLRRFLGNTNFDFLLCEEATHEFDKDYKIDAYEYCFKNNLPFHWKTKSSTEGSPQVRQFLLTGKYELINVTYHDYECESTRGYVTFECNISGRNITFIVCHLSLESSSDGIRQQEMGELANILKKCEYGVLCGDFNAFSIDEFTTHFSEFNLSNHGYYGDFNTWPVTGWESWNHCIDNIITTKSIKITNVLMGEIAMSDHKPLIAEIEIL